MTRDETIESLRIKFCTNCPFVGKKKDCVDCYETNIVRTRQKALKIALERGIPEILARRMFRGGASL